MVDEIEIQGLRGIKQGKLEKLSPLVILVGPNGCGKSTILDALLIGACHSHGAAVQIAISRNSGLSQGLRWFAWKGQSGLILVSITTAFGKRVCKLACRQEMITLNEVRAIGATNVAIPAGGAFGWNPNIRRDRLPRVSEPPDWIPEVQLVDCMSRNEPIRLHQVYTSAVEAGNHEQIRGIVSEALTGVEDIRILTEGDTPVVHVVFADRSVPVTQCGDGIHALVRLALELAARRDGLVLLEEPEVQLHPRAIRQSARIIHAAVRRGIQVVLTTHSLELIDALVYEATDADLGTMSLYRLQLHDGDLRSSRLTGQDVRFSRQEIEDDLR